MTDCLPACRTCLGRGGLVASRVHTSANPAGGVGVVAAGVGAKGGGGLDVVVQLTFTGLGHVDAVRRRIEEHGDRLPGGS